jgi:hypothetical protein
MIDLGIIEERPIDRALMDQEKREGVDVMAYYLTLVDRLKKENETLRDDYCRAVLKLCDTHDNFMAERKLNEQLKNHQVPGVPDGYELVRIDCPKTGELFITTGGGIMQSNYDGNVVWPVVRKKPEAT